MMQAKHGLLAHEGLLLLLNILLNSLTNVLWDLQRIARGVQVAALHKVIDIDGGTAQKIEFQRLFFVFHALRQTLRIKRLFDGLRHQRSALLLNARFPHLLFNCGTFTDINMPVALGRKDRARINRSVRKSNGDTCFPYCGSS